MHHCVHAEGCSPRRCLGTTFKFCAARRGGQGCFNAVSEFSSFLPNFPLVSSLERKIRYVLKKNGTDPGKNSVAGAGPLGKSGPGGPDRDGGPGRDGAGAGLGRGGGAGGRACSYINTRIGIS